jgi:NTE family protein
MSTDRVGLVLSGGGARGAYEAGVIAGLMEVLGLRPRDTSPFQIFAGTSVGAINSTYLASRADRGDCGVDDLVRLWCDLRIERHLRIDLLGILGVDRSSPMRKLLRRGEPTRFGHFLLDPRPLEHLVESAVPWDRLHRNVDSGLVHALVVAALHISSGRTTMFAELAPTAEFRMTRDPRRVAQHGRITADHVLGSAAIPLLFPARRIGDGFYADGGLRFNTPISPAIRTGSDRLVVVSVMHRPSEGEREPDATLQYPHPAFLLGKLMNALLLDPVAYDLYVLERFNKLIGVIEDGLQSEGQAAMDSVLEETRGAGYRKIDALVFQPSRDIGRMAGQHLLERKRTFGLDRLEDWLLGRGASADGDWEADLASYLLFDGSFATKLLALGMEDARRRADAIKRFWGA